MQECQICQEPFKKAALQSCPCALAFCSGCASQLKEAKCPGCFQEWTCIPKAFVKIAKTLEEERLWTLEQTELPKAKDLLEWTNEVEILKKQLRFGTVRRLPSKPKTILTLAKFNFFACPASDCNGFVQERVESSSSCMSCRAKACTQCHESQTSSHECRKDILENMALLRKDCRNCPKCATLIFKTQGCDHMICTRCRNHFSWKTGEILKVSTNGHYNNTVVYDTNVKLVSQSEVCQQDEHDLTRLWPDDQAPKDSPLARIVQEVQGLQCLWSQKFQNVDAKHIDSLMALRVKFLRKELSDADFKSKLYTLHEAYKIACHDRDFVRLMCSMISDLVATRNEVAIESTRNHLEEIFFSRKGNTRLEWCTLPEMPWISLK